MRNRCLSLDSYIKPQHLIEFFSIDAVVYLLIPTSNHNSRRVRLTVPMLFISWFLHQTTTLTVTLTHQNLLFISWFLHQTTTLHSLLSSPQRCLSLDSYIKPQPSHVCRGWAVGCLSLDSYIKPQRCWAWCLYPCRCLSLDSYIKPQLWVHLISHWRVVYLLIPTSNHNPLLTHGITMLLFISWFLHQTTTLMPWQTVWPRLFISWFLHQTTTRR